MVRDANDADSMTDKTSLVNGYRVNVVSATAPEENYSRTDRWNTTTTAPGSKWFSLQEDVGGSINNNREIVYLI